jgi:phosphoribosyl 1,2-cyclic phosphate phosphodiesterase
MTTTLTILGCGSSGGVPRIGGDWGDCDPTNPKNRRRRCSLMLDRTTAQGTTRLLIDTSPDLRDQMLSEGVGAIDGVWYTHEHADQPTMAMLQNRFAYCFQSPVGSDYPPTLIPHMIEPGVAMKIDGAGGKISATPFLVHHGNIDVLGFRFGGAAYTPDLNGIPDSSMSQLENLDLWIVDALKRTPHGSHFALGETLAWIARLKPKRAVLTNMHIDMDYDTLRRELPGGIEPAYDGMRLQLGD